jgi:acetyltransferase-like isoleucine patch superfamily enzyme
MRYSGFSAWGRFATWMAAVFTPSYKARRYLSRISIKGYVSPSAGINCNSILFGKHIFIGDRVIIYDADGDAAVAIGDKCSIHQDCVIEFGQAGRLDIGDNTHIQPRCQFSAYKGLIQIGSGVQIAPNCAFYPYDHGYLPGIPIMDQPLQTKGGITIDDDVWIGFGVIVLDGVHIGKGAVIGAGSVVKSNIPPNAIAVGVPARVVKYRNELDCTSDA